MIKILKAAKKDALGKDWQKIIDSLQDFYYHKDFVIYTRSIK